MVDIIEVQLSHSEFWDVLRNVHTCVGGWGGGVMKRRNKRVKRETDGKRRHLGFVNGNRPGPNALLAEAIYIFGTEILEEGTLVNHMHPVVSRH